MQKEPAVNRACFSQLLLAVVVSVDAWAVLDAQQKNPDKPPVGPFGLSRITTANGEPTDIDFFLSNETCGVCHEREFKELQGSMHSAAHTEPLYRNFAELARKEAGDKIYAFCSGCHSAAGVTSGLIPGKHDPDLPEQAKAGVSCDVCHQICAMTGTEGPWGEQGNASFVLQEGLIKFGDSGEVAKNRLHTGEKREFFTKAEFCASCHSVIHPVNGLRIESTYEEWKSSIYAKKGIQCQDCHMRSVEDALKVAETLKPVVVKGQRAVGGEPRTIHPHFFVGGNANVDRLAGGKMHAAMAEKRLKTAAHIELKTSPKATAGKPLPLEIVIHNDSAGHNLPTGVTELRQIWVDLRIVDENGKTLFRSGKLDEKGDLSPGTIWFGAVAVDGSGQKTVKLWEMAQLTRKRAIPPKGAARATLSPSLPAGVSGEITIEAKLLYRSVPPSVVAMVMDQKDFTPKIVEMAETQIRVAID